jgi:hypothetical protein
VLIPPPPLSLILWLSISPHLNVQCTKVQSVRVPSSSTFYHTCIAPTQMSMLLYCSLQSSYRIATLNCLLQQNIQTIFYVMHAICKTPIYIENVLHCGEGWSLAIFFNQDLVISSNLYHVDIWWWHLNFKGC